MKTNNKIYRDIENRFLEFKNKLNEIDQDTSNVSTMSEGYVDDCVDTSTHNDYNIRPNIYECFNRGERRILKRLGYDLSVLEGIEKKTTKIDDKNYELVDDGKNYNPFMGFGIMYKYKVFVD